MSNRYSSQSSYSSSGNRLALESIDNGPPLRIWFSFMFWGSTHEIDNHLRSLKDKTDLCKYHNTKKYWLVEFSLLDSIVAFCSKLQDFKMEELPSFLYSGLKAYRDKLHRVQAMASSDIELNIDPVLMEHLMPFQVEGIKFAVARGGKALIGDEMGCGKTLQAIGIIQHYRNSWPALIIIPPTLISQWHAELTKHCEGLLAPEDICIMRKQTDNVTGRVCIIPYSMFETFVEKKKISKEQFGVVIADESHRIKSKDAGVTKAVVPFLKHAEVSICLSGTPALNRPLELYTQVNALLPQMFSSYDAFVKRYCNAKPSRFNASILDVSGSSNEQELKCLLEGLVMIRRLKSEVLTLPDKVRKVVFVDVDADKVNEIKGVQRQLSHLEQQFNLTADPDTKMRLGKEKESLLTQYYKVTGLAKINSIKKNIMYYLREARMAAEGVRLQDEEKDRERGLESDQAIEDLDQGRHSKPCSSSSSKRTDPVIMELEDDIIIIDDDPEPTRSDAKMASVSSALNDDGEDAEVLCDTDDELKPKKRRRAALSPYSPSKRLHKKMHVEEQEGSDMESKTSIIDLLDEISEEKDEVVDEAPCKLHGNLDSFVVRKPSGRGNKRRASTTKTAASPSKQEGDDLPLGKKILVFAHHKAVLDAIEMLLKEQHVRYIRVDGSTTSAKKGEYLKRFQTDPTVDVAILSITSCGVGLNLTVANLAIFAELYWTPGIVLQAEDRIHRYGQQSENVRIVYLLAKDAADELVWDLIQRKCSTLEATIGTGEKSGRLQHTVTSNDAMGKSSSSQRGSQSATIPGPSKSHQQTGMDQYLTQSNSGHSSNSATVSTGNHHQSYSKYAADATSHHPSVQVSHYDRQQAKAAEQGPEQLRQGSLTKAPNHPHFDRGDVQSFGPPAPQQQQQLQPHHAPPQQLQPYHAPPQQLQPHHPPPQQLQPHHAPPQQQLQPYHAPPQQLQPLLGPRPPMQPHSTPGLAPRANSGHHSQPLLPTHNLIKEHNGSGGANCRQLSAQQLAEIEEKRLAALAIREAKKASEAKKAEMLQQPQHNHQRPADNLQSGLQSHLALPVANPSHIYPTAQPHMPYSAMPTPPTVQKGAVDTGGLTAEQIARMETNRLAALAKLAKAGQAKTTEAVLSRQGRQVA